MSLLNKKFLLGLGVGIALTLVALDLWAIHFRKTILYAGNPWLLEPFLARPNSAPSLPTSSERLPRPWLPEASGQLHDDWSVRPLTGKPLKLSEFKGKVVFLNFWSTS
jgi:hypothetical protein